jgi:hypothetical protein
MGSEHKQDVTEPLRPGEGYRHDVDLRFVTPKWLGRMYFDLRIGRDVRGETRPLVLPASVRRRNGYAIAVLGQMAVSWVVAVVLLVAYVSQVGCGANLGGLPTDGSQPGGMAGVTGGVTIRVAWPEVSAEMIPRATKSILLVATAKDGGKEVGRVVIARGTESGEMTGLIASTVCHIVATAHPNIDGTGNALARAEQDVTIPANTNAQLNFSLASTIVKVEVSPAVVQLSRGETVALTATALDAQGQAVLVGSTWSWTSGTPGVASVSAAGIVTGAGAGTATIQALEPESGRSGSRAVACSGGYAGSTDTLIPVHGSYSATYQGSWASLPTGKELAAWAPGSYTLQDASGPAVKQTFRDQAKVTISGKRLRVAWPDAYAKYTNALYLIQNCDDVTIEDCVIELADGDKRASSVFLIENCGNVVIRNCRVAGAVKDYAIRVEGVTNYFIDRVEAAGIDYGAGPVLGVGIFLSNGAGWDEATQKPLELYGASGYRCMRWGVVQNCYVHDNSPSPWLNEDGILVHSPGDGLIFNCVVENWHADAGIDASHRRSDADYGSGHAFRIERCILDDANTVKTPGTGPGAGHIIWCNNVYRNTSATVYNSGYPCWHVNETFVVDDPSVSSLWVLGLADGMDARYRNCLVSSSIQLGQVFRGWGNSRALLSEVTVDPRNVVYDIVPPGHWFYDNRGDAGSPAVFLWNDWQKLGYCVASVYAPGGNPQFAGGGSYVPALSSNAAAAGTAESLSAAPDRLAVTRDFAGNARANPPAAGAYEAR